MTSKKRVALLSILLISLLFAGSFALLANATTAKSATPIKAIGKAKFVLKGTALSSTSNSITIHVTNTSKNAKVFDGKYQAINIGAKTKITKNGKMFSLGQIKTGNKVRVFGIFDKKTAAITLVRWIKVTSSLSASASATVIYTDKGFFPAPVTIRKGETVVFKNNASDSMWVASNPHPTHSGYPTTGGCVGSTFDACKNIPPGGSWSFTFDISGTWGYHNHLNPSESGTIVVQ